MGEHYLDMTYEEIINEFTHNCDTRVSTQEGIDDLTDYEFVYTFKPFRTQNAFNMKFNKYCVGIKIGSESVHGYNNDEIKSFIFENGVKYITLHNLDYTVCETIINKLPETVEYLALCCNDLDTEVDFIIPPHIKYLYICNYKANSKIFTNLPENLRVLDVNTLCTDFSNLPINLEKLRIMNANDDLEQIVDETFTPNLELLPINLRSLHIVNYNQELVNLPANLEELIIDNYEFTDEITNLPFGLKKIILNCNFGTQFEIVDYPPNLEILQVRYSGSEIIELDKLTKTLKTVYLNGDSFDYNIRKGLPDNIEEIYLYDKNVLRIELLPDTLKKLHVVNFEEFYQEEVDCNCRLCTKMNKTLDIIRYKSVEITIEKHSE